MNRAGGSSYKNTKERYWLAKQKPKQAPVPAGQQPGSNKTKEGEGMKYEWYHTAFKCDECGHRFVRDSRFFWRGSRVMKCPKCKSGYVMVDTERDLDITEQIASRA